MKKIKLFFLRNKDKLFRFLTVFMSCFILLSSSFTVFGATSSNLYETPFSQPAVNANSGYIEITTTNNWVLVLGFTATNMLDDNPIMPQFQARVENDFLIIRCVKPYDDTNPIVLSGYLIDVVYNTYYPLESYEDPSLQNGLILHRWLGNSGSITRAHGYNCDVSLLASNGDFTILYGSDSVLVSKLNLINNTLNSIEWNSDLTVNKLNDLITLVVHTNSNLEQIKSIIQSEGALTRSKIDKVIEYLEAADNGAYYNPADDGTSSTVNNQQQKDEQVMQGTSTGRTEVNNAISGFGGLLTTTGAVFKGSTAMTKIFNLFAQSAYLVPILQISLVLGISSFVLGTAFIVVGKIRNKKE